MAILPITVYGDRILREKAKPVKNIDVPTIELIRNMLETMHNANGVGLAANQVGSDKSIFVIDLKGVEGYDDAKPLVVINPEITAESDEQIDIEEGCLSLPMLRADVTRPESVQLKYLDTDEKEVTLEADDFIARVIQHEFDHLIGKMIPDRIEAFEKQKLQSHLLRIMKRDVDIDYPVTDR